MTRTCRGVSSTPWNDPPVTHPDMRFWRLSNLSTMLLADVQRAYKDDNR
jgi:hypothetical protein